MKIEDIRHSELKEQFLNDCLQKLINNITEEERFYGKKFKTGNGPNKHHFQKILSDNNSVEYWIDSGNIFQYRDQLESVFKRYLYLMETKGI